MHNFSISTYSISGGAWVGGPLGGYGALFRHWGSCAATGYCQLRRNSNKVFKNRIVATGTSGDDTMLRQVMLSCAQLH